MKTKKCIFILMSIMFAFYACGDDNTVSIIDVDDDKDDAPPVERELDSALFGNWILDPAAGSLGVGPSVGDYSWWSNSAADVTTRDCLFSDQYAFNDDGTFQNILGDETWLETWQGVGEDGCGAPVAPHDGSTVGEWWVSNGSLSVSGEGVYMGLSKVHNGGEDGKPANDRITYNYEILEGGTILELTITGWNADVPEAAWYFRFTNDLDSEPETEASVVGTWTLDPTAGSLAVGPNPGDLSWWSISSGDVSERGCLYDDLYIFNEDGTFQNDMGEETWLETWQGVDADGCGAPVAPHDGSTTGDWSVSNSSVTISGEGVFLGLPKVHNGGEDGAPANNTITYTFDISDDDKIMELTIDGWHSDVPEATWYFRFARQE